MADQSQPKKKLPDPWADWEKSKARPKIDPWAGFFTEEEKKRIQADPWAGLFAETKKEKPQVDPWAGWGNFGPTPKPELKVVLVPEEEEERKRQIAIAKRDRLGRDILKGLFETLGFAEAPYALATGVTGWLGGLLAVPTKMIYDAWKSGGRDISFTRAEKAMEDVMNFMAYRPETELGQTLSQIAAAPFSAYLDLMGKGVEKITDDEEKKAALRIIGNYALLLLPKFVKGGKGLLAKRLKGIESLTGEEIKGIAKEAPEQIKEILNKIPDEMDISVKPTKQKYPFFPKDAPGIWYDIMDATSGKGIRPFKDARGKFIEYEEYKSNVPKQLRKKQGLPPDEVADMLGLEDSQALYRELQGKAVSEVEIPEWYQVAEEAKLTAQEPVMKAEAEILSKTGKPQEQIAEFLDNTFMDGERLRTVANEVVTGKRTVDSAVKEINELIEDTVRPAKGVGVERPEGAVRSGVLAFGMELPKSIGNIRIDKINSSYDVKKTLVDIAEMVKTETDAYREPVTWIDREKFAKDLGMTVDELMKKREGEALNATEMEAARRLQGASIVEVNKAMKVYGEDPSYTNLINFRAATERAGLIVKTVSQAKTEAARALNILRKEYEPGEFRHRAMERVLQQLGGVEKNVEIYEKMTTLDWGNPAEISKFLRDLSNPKISDMVFEVWINALLSGIPTQVRNIASNTLNLLTKPIEKGVAATVEAARRLTGAQPKVYFGEVPFEVFGIFNGIPEGVRKALYAWTNEITMEGASKLEARHRQAIPGRIGKVVRIPGRALIAADEFFKAIVYTSDIHAMAYRRAVAEGLKGKVLIDRVTELVRNPDRPMMEHATGEMLYRTFQKELGKWGKATQKFRETIEPVRWIVPFMRVSINIPKYAFERTPFNLPRVLYRAAKGQYKGAEFAENVSRPLIGSLVSIGVFIETMKGNITGSGPTDREERQALYRQGWTPYSIKIGDKYYSYAGIEPLATMFGVTADMAEVWQDIEEGDRDDLASKLILAFTENITNKTFMRGVSEALNAISDPERHGERWLSTFAGTVVPTGVAYIARAMDPYFRDAKSTLDQIKSRIPKLSETLSPKRDLWGRPIERKGSFFEKLVSPVWVSEEDITDVDQELKRLKYFPGMPQREIRGFKLTPEEYNEFSEMAGKATYNLLSEIVKSEAYQSFDDEEKLDALKKAINAAREISRLQFMILHPIKGEKEER